MTTHLVCYYLQAELTQKEEELQELQEDDQENNCTMKELIFQREHLQQSLENLREQLNETEQVCNHLGLFHQKVMDTYHVFGGGGENKSHE